MEIGRKKFSFWLHRTLKKFWQLIHFHKTIRFKTLKEYLDFKESRWPVILFKLGLFYPGFFSPVGLSVELTKPEDFDEEQIVRSQSRNLSLLSKEVKNNLDKKVSFEFHKGKVYWLKGLEVTHEDYYYILEDETGRKRYETCVGGITFVE